LKWLSRGREGEKQKFGKQKAEIAKQIRNSESRKQKFISAFQISFSVFVLCLFDHRCQDGHKFIGFSFQGLREIWINPALLAQKLQPKGRLVSFLQGAPKLRYELVV
jgi:hypothetical protein